MGEFTDSTYELFTIHLSHLCTYYLIPQHQVTSPIKMDQSHSSINYYIIYIFIDIIVLLLSNRHQQLRELFMNKLNSYEFRK